MADSTQDPAQTSQEVVKSNFRKTEVSYSKNLIHYPSEQELELLILKLGLATPTLILKDKGIPVNPGTITVMQKRMQFLANQDKIILKKFSKMWIAYPKAFEKVRERELQKMIEALGYPEYKTRKGGTSE